jgi:oxalate decarboxylase/phosphoglucose isomerase-like protein (cupin superfamily)
MHESGRVQGLRHRSDRCETAKEATVAEFPVSDKFASVYMTLEPGALREMHWHANE